jgi:hypothetical protein
MLPLSDNTNIFVYILHISLVPAPEVGWVQTERKSWHRHDISLKLDRLKWLYWLVQSSCARFFRCDVSSMIKLYLIEMDLNFICVIKWNNKKTRLKWINPLEIFLFILYVLKIILVFHRLNILLYSLAYFQVYREIILELDTNLYKKEIFNQKLSS